MKEIGQISDEELRRAFEAAAPALPPRLAAGVHARARAAFEGRGPTRLVAVATAVGVLSAIGVYLTWAVSVLGALAGG